MSQYNLPTYPFEFCEVLHSNNPEHYFKAIHVYKFNADTTRYLVTVEEYLHHVYVIQYCLEEHADNTDKFNVLVNVGSFTARKVIATCFQIGVSIHEKYPLASFVFVASPTPQELAENNRTATKRLAVNKYFAERFCSPEDFTHVYLSEPNLYLMVNKKYEQEVPDLYQQITQMLSEN